MWMNVFKRSANRREIEADIDEFLAEKTEALVKDGFSPEEARQRARREFGNVTLMKELSREEWNWRPVEQWVNAARYALKSLRRNPGFTATVLLTLGVGIGTNAAIFNLLHAVVLRSLPVPDAQQLRLLSVVRNGKEGEAIFSYPILVEMQTVLGEKSGLAGYSSIAPMRANTGNGEPEQAGVQLVSGTFFRVLGVTSQAGRLLSAWDDAASATYPAVISGAYWASRFGRDPGVIGRTVSLNDTPVTIVGVAPDSFFGLQPGSRPAYWLPVPAQHELRYKRNFWNSNGNTAKPFMKQPEIRWLSVVARIGDYRLEPWIATAVNQVYARDMQREARGWDDPVQIKTLLHSTVRLNAGDKGLGDLRQRFAAPLMVLMCAAGVVFLIACLNLASLSLARVTARRKEIAVRCSLGAGRMVIAVHFIAETLLLSLAGGALAVPVAFGASQILLRWASNGNPMPLNVGIDVPVLLFAGVTAFLAGSAFGLAPVLYSLKIDLNEAMKATPVKGMQLPWGRTLIAAEVAFSAILLTGAVLFVRTFLNYADIALGFSPEHVLTVQVDPMGAHMTAEKLLPVYHRVLDRLSEMPGVQNAAFATCGLAQGCKGISGIRVAGRPTEDRSMQENIVTPGYFAAIGMRLLSGRFLNRHDVGNKPAPAVINAAAAKLYFGDTNPIGRRFGYGGDIEHFEVAGVLADARVNNVHEAPLPMAYYSLEQMPAYATSLEIRVRGDARRMEAAIKNAIRQAAPGFPVIRVNPLAELVGSDLLRERLVARLASAFALLAIGLACLGLYGVLSYATTRRTSEIGIRLALGAQGGDVCWMILREALMLIGIGLMTGIPAAIVLMKFVRGLLYGVSAGDPGSILVGILSLLLIGSAAAFLPAWRASRIDPTVALRYE